MYSSHLKIPMAKAINCFCPQLVHALSLFCLSIFLSGLVEGADEARKLFVFGDSYADTGNLARNLAPCWFPPYGITFPHKPAGRFSDGRLLTDFLASLMRIKSPIPYKMRTYGPSLLPYGMNFAAAGSGVFDTGNLQRNLSTQIHLLQAQIDAGVFSTNDVKSSVALVAVSGNDYARLAEQDPHYLLHIGRFMDALFAQLDLDMSRLGQIGIPKVILTNLHPIACTPLYTRPTNYTACASNNITAAVAEHNYRVDKLIDNLNRATNGSTAFVSLDVNAAFSQALTTRPLAPCCESSSNATRCGQLDDKGNKLYSVCQQPEQHFYWDSLHPTQAGWVAAFQYLKPALRRFLGA